MPLAFLSSNYNISSWERDVRIVQFAGCCLEQQQKAPAGISFFVLHEHKSCSRLTEASALHFILGAGSQSNPRESEGYVCSGRYFLFVPGIGGCLNGCSLFSSLCSQKWRWWKENVDESEVLLGWHGKMCGEVLDALLRWSRSSCTLERLCGELRLSAGKLLSVSAEIINFWTICFIPVFTRRTEMLLNSSFRMVRLLQHLKVRYP